MIGENDLKIQENDSLKNENVNNAIHIFDVVFWFALRKENSDD
jgi:hypothetical protein